MARQRMTRPGNRQQAVEDDSLLIRSAESLGRMIGSLQRQLDAARRLASRSAETAGNGHVIGRKRSGAQAKPKMKAKSAAKSKKAAPPRRTATKRKTAKPQR